MAPTIVLITGANRGIGRGLLESYLARPNHTVIAAVRDPNHATARELTTLPHLVSDTSLVVTKLDLTVASDPAAAVADLADRHGIRHVDILVANAGIALKWVEVSEVTPEDIQKHFDVNVHGFVRLFQAFRPVLQRAEHPKWVTIGSSAAVLTVSLVVHLLRVATAELVADVVRSESPPPSASPSSGSHEWCFLSCFPTRIYLSHPTRLPATDSSLLTACGAVSPRMPTARNFLPMKNAAYAPSKVVQHWLTKAIHTEQPWINAFPVDPG